MKASFRAHWLVMASSIDSCRIWKQSKLKTKETSRCGEYGAPSTSKINVDVALSRDGSVAAVAWDEHGNFL
jgi:hypothetical protein